MLVRSGAVEEVSDIQEVRGSILCKDGNLYTVMSFVSSALTLAVNLHNFTVFHRKIMVEICGEKTNFSPLILHIFPIFSRPGKVLMTV